MDVRVVLQSHILGSGRGDLEVDSALSTFALTTAIISMWIPFMGGLAMVMAWWTITNP